MANLGSFGFEADFGAATLDETWYLVATFHANTQPSARRRNA